MRQLLKSSLVLFSTFVLIVAFQNCSRDSFQSRLPSKLTQAANDQLDLPSEDFADEDILDRDDIFNPPPNDNAPSASSESVAEEDSSILATAATTSGRVFYVATNGSDNNPGTISKPFKTVQRAIKVPLKPGDIVLIRKGRHAPFDLININGAPGKPITFKGEAGAIIDRNLAGPNRYRNIEIAGGSYISIDGLELIDSAPSPYRAKTCEEPSTATGRNGIKMNKGSNGKVAHQIVIKNLHVHGLQGHPVLGKVNQLQLLNNHFHDGAGYGTYLQGREMVIRGNRIHDLKGHGMRFANQGLPDALLVDSIIENNIIYNNGGTGPFWSGLPGDPCRMITGGDGIVVWHGSGNIIRNNIIYNNVGYGIRVNEDFLINKKPNLVYNNTVYKNGINSAGGYPGIYCYAGQKTIVKNNIVHLSGMKNIFSGCTNQLSNNLTTDPKFVNASALDFRLRLGSPAINKGATLNEALTDFYGVKRPQGGAYDFGAIEFK